MGIPNLQGLYLSRTGSRVRSAVGQRQGRPPSGTAPHKCNVVNGMRGVTRCPWDKEEEQLGRGPSSWNQEWLLHTQYYHSPCLLHLGPSSPGESQHQVFVFGICLRLVVCHPVGWPWKEQSPAHLLSCRQAVLSLCICYHYISVLLTVGQ